MTSDFRNEAGGVYRSLTLARTSPRSFLFYIVANVGPGKTSRPLAVTYRQGHRLDPCRLGPVGGRSTTDCVALVMKECARIASILTEPANRIALEAERDLATSWYGQDRHDPPEQVELPDTVQPPFNFEKFQNEQQDIPERPWAAGIREFPFISTCLRVGLHSVGYGETRLLDVQEQPLGTVFRGDKLEYGVVVFDVSDLDAVRYGLIGFHVDYTAEVDVTRTGHWDRVEDSPPSQDPVLVLEEPRSRVFLTAAKYAKKFPSRDLDPELKQLKKLKLADPAALDYIWPDVPSEVSTTSRNLRSTRSRRSDTLSRTIDRVVQEAVRKDSLNTADLADHLEHPDFQTRLLESIHANALPLGPSKSLPRLLRLAYTGHAHLNWVAFANLTYESVAAAIESLDPNDGATALSLCVDDFQGSPQVLLTSLSRSQTIRNVCFLQGPTRVNDNLSSQLFAQLCTSPSGLSLLQSKNFFFTCAYSAPLQRTLWLPDPQSKCYTGLSFAPPVEAFPVQQMFVRQQFIDSDDAKFRPCHFYLGDALLAPERFVIGFLQYCQSVLTDKSLFSFTNCPPELSSFKNKLRGLAISPIPAENFAIPDICTVTAASPNGSSEEQVDCWSLVRDMEPGTWTVLVSHEWYGHPSPNGARVPFIRYAFLRARQRIAISDYATTSAWGPEHVDVIGGLKDFLREAAPNIEATLINRPFHETIETLASRWPTKLGTGMSYLSELDDSGARSILRDFLQDAAFVKRHLRLAMQAKPEQHNWYPELLNTLSVEVDQPPARNMAVFKSLVDRGVQGELALGTEKKVDVEFYDDDL